jgi:hypothetical protein
VSDVMTDRSASVRRRDGLLGLAMRRGPRQPPRSLGCLLVRNFGSEDPVHAAKRSRVVPIKAIISDPRISAHALPRKPRKKARGGVRGKSAAAL